LGNTKKKDNLWVISPLVLSMQQVKKNLTIALFLPVSNYNLSLCTRRS